ncbi:MAG: hypothetical protein HY289_00930 [Planctomycetes bacterium]|nr:hypothetical protein [Planctomycetota bacterium]
MIRIFKYLPDVDAFVVTDEYRVIADSLGLTEWHPAVWIGRLFILDNDLGEHWFDNWDEREKRGLSEEYFVINPTRFKDGRDGPCHSDEFRQRFWTDVLTSLELSLDLLFDEARQSNEQMREFRQKYGGPDDVGFDVIADLEERIARLRVRFGKRE